MKRYLNVALLFLTALSALPAAAQSRPLSYSNYLPPTHATNRYALEPMFKAVEQETGGSLKITLHPGGSMVGGKGTISAIRDGMVDGGFIVTVYHQNEIPLNTALTDLAFMVENPLVAMGAVNETVLLNCADCLQEYRKYKTVYMGAYATTPYLMMCKKPVQSLADLKGLKMRAAGTVWGRWATKLGGVPVNIPNSEAYEAIERGQLDCMIGSLAWLQTLSLWDLTKNVIDLPMGAYLGGAFIAFNDESWKKVKESDRAVFIRHIPTALARLAIGYVKDDHDVVAQARQKNVVIRKPDPAMVSLLQTYRQEEVRNAIEAARERGARNPEAAVDAFLKNLKKWEAIVAKTGDDPVKYEAALREHIYNKVKF